MAKKITFNPISNNFDYVNDTTKLEYDLSKKQSKDVDSVNGNLAIFDNNGQTTDSGKTIGKETITKNTYYVLRNINDDTQNVYCLEKPISLSIGSIIYADKECTTEYGKVSYYMSGTIRIDTDTSIFWAIDYEPKEFVSSKRVATESAVVDLLKKSDWNQSDETATDYIKNRTHYEKLEDYREMSDDEYNEKKANGSTFVLMKVATATINSNEYSGAKGVEVGDRNDFNKLFYNLLQDKTGTNTNEGNKTKICYRIAINGVDVDLQWHKTEVYSGNEEVAPDGTYEVFYGFAPSDDWRASHYVVGNGIIVKCSTYAKGYYNGQSHYGFSAFLIDSSIYGEAPYTIDFYLERKLSIKKLDEKYLPDSVWANEPKHKTGDVMCSLDNGKFKVINWEDYEANPTAYNPIGLVANPVKRTFLFCELLKKPFATIANIKKYLYGYTSLENGEETRKRLDGLSSANASSFPAFYDLKFCSKLGTIFYDKQFSAYTPALFEWQEIYNPLCRAFYDDPINSKGNYASLMDRLLALKNGTEPQENTFFFVDKYAGYHSVYYAQLSSVGVVSIMDNYAHNDITPFTTSGVCPAYDTLNYNLSPVFGLYTEDEE